MLDEQEIKKLNMLRERLRGVPPPPTITNPRISMDEALPRLRDYFGSPPTETVQSRNDSEFPATFDVYQNTHPVCETLDMLYEKIRKRCVTHETTSFIGSPPPPPPPPPSPLQTCDFVDLLPRSLSSPASPAPDLLSLELVQRRNRSNVGRRTKPAVPKMAIRKPNPRLLDALVSEASGHKTVVRSDLQMSSKLHSRMISVPKKEVPASSATSAATTSTAVPETKTHEQLSVIHRKKLLWATSQAIKITFPELSSDSGILKRNVAALFRLCLTQWLLVRNDAHDAGKGTSERMLELATRLAPSVVSSL